MWLETWRIGSLENWLNDYNRALIGADSISPPDEVTAHYSVGLKCPTRISRVIFSPPATIVFWKDGTKTVVKCENEPFDAEKGIAMAVAKKMLTSKDYNRLLDTAFDYRESVCIDNSHHTRKRRRKHGKRA